MRLLARALLAVWLCCHSTTAAAEPPSLFPRSSQAKCPLTSVPRYQFYCEIRGWVQEPFNLAASKQKTVAGCAGACHKNADCKSVKYIAATGECQLYSKYLIDMATDTKNFKPGVLYDADCFTRDCNLIDACKASQHCPELLDFSGYLGYAPYACAYGYTAQIGNFTFQEILLPAKVQATCEALTKCSGNLKLDTVGTIDVHYDIPDGRWVCRGFNDLDYKAGYGIPSYDYPSQQDATHDRYTFRNTSVGAGYGFYLAFEAP